MNKLSVKEKNSLKKMFQTMTSNFLQLPTKLKMRSYKSSCESILMKIEEIRKEAYEQGYSQANLDKSSFLNKEL